MKEVNVQTELEHPEDALPDDFVDGMLTRKEAAGYLADIGVPRTIATLARLYSTTDDGPPCIHRGRIPVYPKRALHEWAMRQLSRVRRRAAHQRFRNPVVGRRAVQPSGVSPLSGGRLSRHGVARS